jgi:hypothetical protein
MNTASENASRRSPFTTSHSSVKDGEVFGNDYLVYRCDQVPRVDSVKSAGGGVVIAVKNRGEIQSERMTTANGFKDLWDKIAFDNVDLIVCGLYLPHSAPDEYCRRHIESVEQVLDGLAATDLVLICGDYNEKYPWFDRELHNFNNKKIKAQKFMKRVSKTYERMRDEEDK